VYALTAVVNWLLNLQCISATELKADQIKIPTVAPSFIVTVAVIGYSAVYLDQMRMMLFLSLQSLIVPVYKHRCCRVEKAVSGVDNPGGHDDMNPGGQMEYSAKRVLPTMAVLTGNDWRRLCGILCFVFWKVWRMLLALGARGETARRRCHASPLSLGASGRSQRNSR